MPGRAEELYLCDGGRLVRVDPETIEGLKRTDPCIARYFGLEIAAAAAAPPKPAIRETGALPGSAAEASPPPPVEPRFDAGVHRRAGRPAGGGATRYAARPTPRVKPDRVDVPGDGYRKVEILNAEPGDAALYRHLD